MSEKRSPQGKAPVRRTSAAGGAPVKRSSAVPSGTRPHRKLTPEQKKRIIRNRRIRKLKKNLVFIIPVCVGIIAAILLFTLTSGSKKPDTTVSNVVPAQDSSVINENISEVAEDNVPTDTDQTADGLTDEPDVTALPEQSGGSAAAATQTYDPNTTFNFDEAYVKAVLGETTGPAIVPKKDNIDASKGKRWPSVKEGYIPTVFQANNVEEKVICITVDDCFQGENLRSIVQCALDNNGKLTIFPIGKNLTKDSVASAVKWAWENGMEIENHTYNHVALCHYDDTRSAQEIWYQRCQLNEVLGVEYTQHWFRPRGGDERDDQRLHAFANQLGYYGIAMWTIDGSKSSIEYNKSRLAPGAIYLFHTTDSDLKLMTQLIPYAVSQGYRLVTMNEMFGLPDNETSTLVNTMSSEYKKLQPFQIVPAQLKKTIYMRAAGIVQQRLIDLGWLTGEVDCVYGNSCYQAIGYFQQAMGLEADGIAGAETQKVLFSDSAKHK